MQHFIKKATLLIILLACNMLTGQTPVYKSIDKSNGLPSNNVYDIFQDSKGYMWFTCDKGLIKYDGFEFKLYNSKRQSSKSGTNIQEDKLGRLWYQNFDGYVFYVENDSLCELKQYTPIGYFNYALINDYLFVMQVNSVSVYDVKTLKVVKQIPINTNQISTSIGDDSNYYIYSNENIIQINSDFNVSKFSLPSLLTPNGHSMLLNMGSNIVVYGKNTSKVPDCYSIKNNKVESKFKVEVQNIQNASFTQNEFWFCTSNGAYAYDIKGNILNKGKCYFQNYSISDVLKDREGNYWFSTLNNGLLLATDINAKQYLKDIAPLKTTIYKNEVYVGTRNGKLFKADLNEMQEKLIYESKLNAEISTLWLDSIRGNILLSNSYVEILNDKYKLISSEPGAFKDIRRVDSNYYAIALSGAAELMRNFEINNDVWVSLFNKGINDDKGKAKFLGGCRARCVEYLSNEKNIYYGTSYGLYVASPGGIEELKSDTSRIYVSRMYNYNGVIYGLTNSGLIVKIKNKKIEYLNFKFYEDGETVSFLKRCGDYLIMVTNDNLYSFNMVKQNLVLQHRINYDITDIELWNGELLLTTKNGLIKEKLKASVEEKSSPLFYISEVHVNSTKLANFKELDYNQNNIEINYSILSFKTDFNFPLFYKINDEPWEKANAKSRSLKLSSLAPGAYVIQFQLGEPGNAKYLVHRIDFIIAKPFWQSFWFIALCFVILLGFVFLIFKWRINELNAKNILLEEKVKNEQLYYKSSLKAIRAQMNPHFFYNALNTIQSFIYSEDKKNASAYLSKFSKLTRLILEMSEKETISLSEEISALQLYLDIEKARFNDDFEFTIDISLIKNTDVILFPPMLIQPHVENAVKHGLLHKKDRKILKIVFNFSSNVLNVIIEDNGIGRKQSAALNEKKREKHKSFSTDANQNRLDILNKQNKQASIQIIDLTDGNNVATGTRVVLNIPTISFTNQNDGFAN